MMNRRDFFRTIGQVIGTAIVALVIPKPVSEWTQEFTPWLPDFSPWQSHGVIAYHDGTHAVLARYVDGAWTETSKIKTSYTSDSRISVIRNGDNCFLQPIDDWSVDDG